jgi:ubiquilin
MGPMPNTQDMLRLMEDPNFVQQMNEALNNPDVLRMIRNSPMMRDNPMMQAMLDNPEMRRVLFNPDMIRLQMQMQRSMAGGDQGSAFPAPGATNTTPQGAAATPSQNEGPTQPNAQAPPPPNPFTLFGNLGGNTGGNTGAGGAGGAGANPFASLFGTPFSVAPPPSSPTSTTATQGSPDQDTNRQGATSSPPPNPFASLFGPPPGNTSSGQQNPFATMTQQIMQNPDAMRAVMNMMGSLNDPTGTGTGTQGAGSGVPNLFNPYGGAFGVPPQPQQEDTRPPEERYAEQLRQLNDMGFYEFERNVQALRRSGGSVQGAVEYLLSNT